jgi:hypothetical protein
MQRGCDQREIERESGRVCVCEFVCEREREREKGECVREKGDEREKARVKRDRSERVGSLSFVGEVRVPRPNPLVPRRGVASPPHRAALSSRSRSHSHSHSRRVAEPC